MGGMLDDLLGGGFGVPSQQPAAFQQQPIATSSIFTAYDDPTMCVGFQIKRDGVDPTTFNIRAYY